MGNKRIIVKPDGQVRKVCQKTKKIYVKTNFCPCGRKRCSEGFRLNPEKALCKNRGFRDKFRLDSKIEDDGEEGEEKIEFRAAESDESAPPAPPCWTLTLSF